MTSLVVSQLWCYPIKSCAGHQLITAQLGPRGIVGDREFMVVRKRDRVFISQRQFPRMALIMPYVQDDTVKLNCPGVGEVSIPIIKEGKTLEAKVWTDWCKAHDQGNEASRWLKEALGGEYLLVRIADDHVRPLDPQYRPRSTDQTGFADAYPLLLTTERSLQDLNERLITKGSDTVRMNRFRPNIVVNGTYSIHNKPYFEDRWHEIQIGSLKMWVVKPCSRCNTIKVEQETGVRGEEPYQTLEDFREDKDGKIYFGQNIVHAEQGVIKVGDVVKVITYK